MKNYKYLINAVFLLAFFLIQPKAYAQDDEERELITIATVAASSWIVPLLIPNPKPEFIVTDMDLRVAKKKQNNNLNGVYAKLSHFSEPLMIEDKYSFKKKYGVIKSFSKKYLILQNHTDSLTILINNIREIIDLKSAANRSRMKRIKRGITYAGLALASIRFSFFINNPDANILKTSMQISSLLFGFGALYSFATMSDIERIYARW